MCVYTQLKQSADVCVFPLYVFLRVGSGYARLVCVCIYTQQQSVARILWFNY